MSDVTNPGVVTVADEAYDGLPINVPAFDQVPASTSPNNVNAGSAVAGKGTADNSPGFSTVPVQHSPNNTDGGGSSVGPLSADQAVLVSTPGVSLNNVPGANYKPGNATLTDVTANNVAGQVYGTGTPANVFV